MNLVLMANIEAIIIKKGMKKEKSKHGIRLRRESKSREIISYLLEDGETSSSNLMRELSIKSSPACYIRTHIQNNYIICDSLYSKTAMYSINAELDRSNFLFA